MRFEGPVSESGEVNADLSGTSWLKMARLCADAVAHKANWMYLEAQVKLSGDPQMIFG